MRIFRGYLAISLLALSVAAASAFADETPAAGDNNSAKPDSETSKTNTGAENVDDLITNNNLRAYSGSKSKLSIASTFDYLGGTIANPFSQDRPDIAGASGTTTKADLDGSISVKYNFDQRNALLAGIGIRWIAPLAGTVNNYDGTRFDAINPYLTYQYIYQWFGIQSVLQVSGMQWTQADQTALGYAQQISVDQENMWETPIKGLSIGASIYFQYQWFNKSGSFGTPGSDTYIGNLEDAQSVYEFNFSPIVEYQLSEKVNLRTLISPAMYEHYKSSPEGFDTLVHDVVYQSVGVGISITRDIFLYPNVQFLPGDFIANETNVGLTATINLF